MSEHNEPLRELPMRPFVGQPSTVVGQVPLSEYGSRSAAEMVAAVNALHRAVEMADENCDGVADDVQISEAIGSLPA